MRLGSNLLGGGLIAELSPEESNELLSSAESSSEPGTRFLGVASAVFTGVGVRMGFNPLGAKESIAVMLASSLASTNSSSSAGGDPISSSPI